MAISCDIAYNAKKYLIEKDDHIGNLISWIHTIECLKDQIRISERDSELEEKLDCISMQLMGELGVRTYHATY